MRRASRRAPGDSASVPPAEGHHRYARPGAFGRRLPLVSISIDRGVCRGGCPSMLMRFIPGDDIFVSYSRADAVRYAEGLASELADRGFSCRLDQWDSEPGADMQATLVRGLRRSAMLVILGTPAAEGGRHPWVRRCRGSDTRIVDGRHDRRRCRQGSGRRRGLGMTSNHEERSTDF